MERLRSSISVNTLTWTAIYNSRVTVEEATYTSSIRVGIDGTVTLSKLSSQVIAGLYVFFHITFI